MANAVLAWRNWCAEGGTISATSSAYAPDAPLTNLLTPRTSELAIQVAGVPPLYGFNVRFDGYGDSPPVTRPVQIVALLNHNIVEIVDNDDFYFTVYSTVGTVDIGAGQMIFTTGSDFQSHVFLILPAELQVDRVDVRFNSSVVFGQKDPYTGEITSEQFQAGGIWAGPIWRPTHGIKFGAFGQGVTENLRGATSIGGQFYPNPQPRQRTSGFDFTLLSEPEVYSVDPDQPSLQQLGSWCARSRPLIVIPADDNDELVYAQGMYGYLTADPQWQQTEAAQTADVATKGRVYSGGLQMREAL